MVPISKSLAKFGVLLGFISLLHAAFSAAQYRSFLRVSKRDFDGTLPVDIVAQAIGSLLILLYSIVFISDDFKTIYADDKFSTERHDQVFSTQQPSFLVFNHRGRIL